MPLRRHPDPSIIGVSQKQDAVKNAVAVLAHQIHAAAANVERVVAQEVLRDQSRELERNRR